MTADEDFFSTWVSRWRLTADGAPIATRTSRLLPVRTSENLPAMLKIALISEEKSGAAYMVWRAGEGAARVLAHEGDALLMERATNARSLSELAREDRAKDDEATKSLCAVIEALHRPRRAPPASLIPLESRFKSLFEAGRRSGGTLELAAAKSRELCANFREVRELHGDVHHGNVLYFGERGWLAVDPKGLVGERAFDYANLFCNPDPVTAREPGRLARLVPVVCEASGLEPRRLLEWVVAWSALSAVWMVEDGEAAEPDLAITEAALAEISG